MLKPNSKLLVLFLLAFLILGKSFALIHSFSHYDFKNGVVETSKHDAAKKIADCALCHFSNLQNAYLEVVNLVVVSTFLLIFAVRFFLTAKISFLRNSFLSRAPPVVS